VENAPWVTQHFIHDEPMLTILKRDLDQGEAESIALAGKIKADLILLDEKEARHVAHSLGLNVMGVAGILLLAHDRREIETIKLYLDALRQTAGFYLIDSLYQAILKQVKEDR
jgi:predicted nucleic acid-binding protein